MLPILYSFRRCPYAIRARLALCQAGVAVELREVVLSDKPAELLAASAAGTVPVLQRSHGKAIVHSRGIMQWALEQRDGDGWLERADTPALRALVDACDGDFKHALDRYKYADRHPGRSPGAWRNEAVTCLVEALEERLAGSPQLGGERPCLADAAIFPFVRQFAAVDPAWWAASPWVATRRWHDAWAGGALMATAMHRVPRWRPGDPPTLFPAALPLP